MPDPASPQPTERQKAAGILLTIRSLSPEVIAYLEDLQKTDVKPGDPRMQTVIGGACKYGRENP